MKKSLHIILWIGFFLGTVIMLSFSSSKQDNKLCSDLKIHIDTETGMHFITEDDIIAALRIEGLNPVGQPMGEVDLKAMENILMQIPEIKKAEVYKNMNGEIGIKIQQRVPIARVFNQSGRNFYLDDEGFQMPVSEKYSPRVMVFTGNINDPATDLSARELDLNPELDKMYMADEIFQLAKFISDDEFWSAQIQQIHVNASGEFELIPTVGNHRVIFGSLENMNGKFKKLFVFYKEGLNNTDWEKYDSVNVKYKHQIICTKK
jgi:cell division protein FtsQ